MFTLFVILAVTALFTAIAAIAQPAKCPLWVPVFFLAVIEVLRVIPAK